MTCITDGLFDNEENKQPKREKQQCFCCEKKFYIQDQPPESPVRGKLGWYCSMACWRDIEGPVSPKDSNNETA